MTERVTIGQVAVAAGVSTATVSRVMCGSQRVSPPLTARVIRTMAQLGYRRLRRSWQVDDEAQRLTAAWRERIEVLEQALICCQAGRPLGIVLRRRLGHTRAVLESMQEKVL